MSSAGAIKGKCFIEMSRLTEAATYLGRDPSTPSLAVKHLEEQIQCETRLRKECRGSQRDYALGGKPSYNQTEASHHIPFHRCSSLVFCSID